MGNVSTSGQYSSDPETMAPGVGQPSSDDIWSRFRSGLPVCKTHAFLNAGTCGPVPDASAARMNEAADLDLRQPRMGRRYDDYIVAMRERVREQLGEVINASPARISLTRSTTEGVCIVVNGLRLQDRDVIVTSNVEHHAFYTALRASPAEVRVVDISDADDDEVVERIRRACCARTRLVALSHVVWSTGRILPIREIAGIGLPVLADGAQSVGIIPTDVEALGCDFLAFPGQKWLMGPEGTGGLFVSADWTSRLRIAIPSSYGHLPWLGRGDDLPQSTAARFDPGALSPMSLAGLGASLDALWALGSSRFARVDALQTAYFGGLHDTVDIVEPQRSSHILSFNAPGDVDAHVGKLFDRGICVRSIPGTSHIRISIGCWNDLDDLARLQAALTEIGIRKQ